MDSLLNTAPCGFLTFADDGTILETNDTLQTMLGHERDAMQGQQVAGLIAAGGSVFCHTYLFPLLKLVGQVQEMYLTLRTLSGAPLPVLLNAVRRERHGSMETDCVFVPIHQRSRYEDEILEAKKQAEMATQAAAQAISALEQARAALELKQQEREQLIAELQQALADVTTLRGLIPICSICKNICDDQGYWNKLENYLQSHTNAEFSHSICPPCSQKYYPELLETTALPPYDQHIPVLTSLRKLSQHTKSVPAIIWAWAQRQGHTPHDLFAYLGGDLPTLERMVHVRVPPPGEDWAGNVEIIAVTFQLDIAALQTILRDPGGT
ncbi:MAG: PAS domain-containing protein [Roseiflexaceae bacterium]|nr:PAS domain-containing protein [Roseiflexaceae bacterium]